MSLFGPMLMTELAVRHEVAQVGGYLQDYVGSRRRWWPKPFRISRRVRKGKRLFYALHWWMWIGPVTFDLYYDLLHNRWALSLERWWRLADNQCRPRDVWLGTRRELSTLLAELVPEAMRNHNKTWRKLRQQFYDEDMLETACRLGYEANWYVDRPDPGGLLRSLGFNDDRGRAYVFAGETWLADWQGRQGGGLFDAADRGGLAGVRENHR